MVRRVRAYSSHAACRLGDSTGIAWIRSGRSCACSTRLSCRCVRFLRVSRRRDSLIHLYHVDGVPRHIFTCESTEHLPWTVPATDGHEKSAASSDRSSRFRRHECSSFLGDRVSIAINFNFHQASPGTADSSGNQLASYEAALAATDVSWLLGLLHPPIGVTRSTSRGPQVFV